MNMDIIGDQAQFMRACGQTVGEFNTEQFVLYSKLSAEELKEQESAELRDDDVEVFDAQLDRLVVLVGEMLSLWPPSMIQAGWHEVMRSNMSKCVSDLEGNPVVIKREDGKILKPDTYSPPDLASIMRRFGYDV